jgi:inositol-1,3,4-trisphosphate 5/6-kinase/inositol-tetrakisphosphate 1-kinase
VEALRTAFGLDLFGFDVLVAASSSPSSPSTSSSAQSHLPSFSLHSTVARYEWLVVDVNYFPSYKEVSDFPSLLASYLTERALQDRTRKLQALMRNPGQAVP